MKSFQKLISQKGTRRVFVCAIAFLLLIAVWTVFFPTQEKFEGTEEERRISYLIEAMEGVDDATVLIKSEGESAISAVVLFTGEDSLLLRMRILSVTATALNLKQSAVQIVPQTK